MSSEVSERVAVLFYSAAKEPGELPNQWCLFELLLTSVVRDVFAVVHEYGASKGTGKAAGFRRLRGVKDKPR